MRDYAALHRQVDDMALASARAVAPIVTRYVRPRSVLDVGCGNGVWLSAFRDAGADDIFGIDGDYLDPSALVVPPERFRTHDLKESFDLGRRFDLVVSLEVAEHLPPDGEDDFVRDLTRHGDVVLFSAAVPGQGGWHHVNERWQSHWSLKFERLGYERIDAIRPVVWANPRVAWWYSQNAFLYVKADALHRYLDLVELSRGERPWPSDMVHPELFRLKALPVPPTPPPRPPLGVRELLAELPRAAVRFGLKYLPSVPAKRS